LPFVGGVRFAHIHSEEIGVVLIVVVNRYDVANLATEGRSGKTPKKNNQRSRTGPLAKMKPRLPIKRQKPRIGRLVA
jgi:hypothetical protein